MMYTTEIIHTQREHTIATGGLCVTVVWLHSYINIDWQTLSVSYVHIARFEK